LTATAEKISSGSVEQEAEPSSISEFDQLARAFNSMTAQLRRSINELEVRVAGRTLELEQRTQQLQAAGEIARDIAQETGLDELLDRAVNLIRERFGFYHAGIFLLDDRKEYALLRAATGEAGREMLARGHRLLVGQVGIVGNAAGSGKARIALDVSADSAHYRNPLLPETRSEMALPLRVGSEVIGALDVQSKKTGAFHEDDISTLQTMADQLAVAIENARLIDRLNQTVVELERSYAQYTEQAWSRLSARQELPAGYRYHENRVDALNESTAEGLPTRTAVIPLPAPQGGEAPGVQLRTPLILRKQVIGVLNLNFRQAVMPPETIQLVEAAAERLALILDNARLLEEAQRRAARERLVGEIGAKLRASNNPQEILQTAVQELQQALRASKAQVTLREGGQPRNPLETGGAPAAGNGQPQAR
jgi:GAF domain-containing protein